MPTPTQQELLRRLADLSEPSPDVRFGQLLAHLGFLGEDRLGLGLGEIDDEQFFAAMEGHQTELTLRQQSVS